MNAENHFFLSTMRSRLLDPMLQKIEVLKMQRRLASRGLPSRLVRAFVLRHTRRSPPCAEDFSATSSRFLSQPAAQPAISSMNPETVLCTPKKSTSWLLNFANCTASPEATYAVRASRATGQPFLRQLAIRNRLLYPTPPPPTHPPTRLFSNIFFKSCNLAASAFLRRRGRLAFINFPNVGKV